MILEATRFNEVLESVEESLGCMSLEPNSLEVSMLDVLEAAELV